MTPLSVIYTLYIYIISEYVGNCKAKQMRFAKLSERHLDDRLVCICIKRPATKLTCLDIMANRQRLNTVNKPVSMQNFITGYVGGLYVERRHEMYPFIHSQDEDLLLTWRSVLSVTFRQQRVGLCSLGEIQYTMLRSLGRVVIGLWWSFR